MEKALTICLFEWRLILRNRYALLAMLGYPIVFGLLAHSHRGLIIALVVSPFLYKGMMRQMALSDLTDVKPLVRGAARSLAAAPIFVIQAALYAAVTAVFRHAIIPTVGDMAFAVAAAMIVSLLVFADS